jgi:hypothetical protein
LRKAEQFIPELLWLQRVLSLLIVGFGEVAEVVEGDWRPNP